MSQIRTRAELERAWFNKKVNYQKDKGKIYEYSFDICIHKFDLNIIRFDLNRSNSTKPDIGYEELHQKNAESLLSKPSESYAYDVILMNPFSHDSVDNKSNNTRIEVDWGDGTKNEYMSGEANIFPFSDVATIYQGDLNSGFKFNDKVDTELGVGRQTYYNMNEDTHGTYIAQKALALPRYKRLTTDKAHIVHKYNGSFRDSQYIKYKVKIRSREFVVPVLVLKKVLYNLFPYKNKIYQYDTGSPNKQKIDDLESVKNVVNYYNIVRDNNFLKNQINGVGKLLTEDGLSRASRLLLMRSSMVVLNSFIPIAISIDGTLPPAFYGNIADDKLGTYIKPTDEILEDIKDIWVDNKPKIKNVSNVKKYNAKCILEGMKKRLETPGNNRDISRFNRELFNGRENYDTIALHNVAFDTNITTESELYTKSEEYQKKIRYIDGLKHYGPVDIGLNEEYKFDRKWNCDLFYDYYSSIGEEHRDAFIISERDLDGERIREKGVCINPFMYLPSRNAVNTLTNLTFESEGINGVKYSSFRNYALSRTSGINNNSLITLTRGAVGVLWNEVHNIYMGAFIDKIKVTGVPIYMYKIKRDDWFNEFPNTRGESVGDFIKRIMNSLNDGDIANSKYKQAKDVLLSRGDWFYNYLQVNTPQVKTIQEILLDLYLKGHVTKEDMEELFYEVPLTIINPFERVMGIGPEVFTKMRNTDRLDGFFCNLFLDYAPKGIASKGESHDRLSFNHVWYPLGYNLNNPIKSCLTSLPTDKIKHMSYVFRKEGCYFYSRSESRYKDKLHTMRTFGGFSSYPTSSVLDALPDSVETVDNLLGFSEICFDNDVSFVLDEDSEFNRIDILDNTPNDSGMYRDKKLKKLTNAFLFCSIAQKLRYNKSRGFRGNLDNISILYGWRHLESVKGLFSYCLLFNNGYISIRDICLKPKIDKYLDATDDVKNKVELSKIIHNCSTIMDMVSDNFILNYNMRPNEFSPGRASTLFYETNRLDRVYQFKELSNKKGYKLIETYLNAKNPTNGLSFVRNDYRFNDNMRIMWDTWYNRKGINSKISTSAVDLLLYRFGLSDLEEVKKYGLGFMFIENGTHPVYNEEVDNRLKFTKVNNYAEGYMRTYSLAHDEAGYFSMHRIDGLLIQYYQHCYLDGFNKTSEESSYYFEPRTKSEYPTYTQTLMVDTSVIQTYTVNIPRCNALLFGRWNSPMGWMFLAGTLDDPRNANYKRFWIENHLIDRFTAACDLTNLEGLFYNVGPLATDLYPQMEIHDYDDFIDISINAFHTTNRVTMTGHRFGFCAERDDNVFIKSDKVYNWKDMFKNDTYYYASATDPLAQATSMDSVEPELARGDISYLTNNKSTENANEWRVNALTFNKI